MLSKHYASQDYEGKDYEGFWSGPGKRYLDLLEQKIVTQSLPGGERVIEIGAGFGRLGNCYINNYKESHMVEPASNLRAVAEETYNDRARYWDSSVYQLPFDDNSFDAALMVRVFHHLDSSEVALKELYRILKSEGRLVFNFSNKRNLSRLFKFLLGRSGNPFSNAREQYEKTLFGHHPDYIKRVLSDVGFSIDQQYAAGISDKVANILPFLFYKRSPSINVSRMMGALAFSPLQFVVAIKK